MIEPANHTAWVDRVGDIWVRADDMPGQYGNWWPLCCGPGWEAWARNDLGRPRTWDQVEEYGPFTSASAAETVRTLGRVRQAVSS